jgi:hypothetical protein
MPHYSILTNTRSFIKVGGHPEGRIESFIQIFIPNVDSVQSFIISIQRFVFIFRIAYDVLYGLDIKIRLSSIISTHFFSLLIYFFFSRDSYVITFLVAADVNCYLDFQSLCFSQSCEVIHSNIKTRQSVGRC